MQIAGCFSKTGLSCAVFQSTVNRMNSKTKHAASGSGLLGVAIFAITLPMTRLATGTADVPELSPWFATLGRAALAGGLSIVFLLATRSRWPDTRRVAPT